MSSGLLDIHVLEETAARVSALTKAIDKQAGVVEKLSFSAQRAAQTTGKVYPLSQLSQFRTNAAAILQVYECLEQATQRVNSLQEPIEQGVEGCGWSEYLNIVAKARSVHADLLNQPELQKFPQLADEALTVYERGEEKLQQYFRRLSKPVLTPSEALLSRLELSKIDFEELKTLNVLRSQLIKFPNALQRVDRSLIKQLELYFTKSTDAAFSAPGASKSVASFPKFVADLHELVLNAAKTLFLTNSEGLSAPAMQTVTEMLNSETRSANERIAKLRSRNNNIQPSLGVNTQLPRTANDASNHRLGSPLAPESPHSMKNLNATSTPPLNATTFNQATHTPTRSSVHSHSGSAPPRRQSHSSQLTGTPYSPASSQQSKFASNQNGPLNASVTSWACLETLESVRNHAEVPPSEISRCKQEGTQLLRQVFLDINTHCHKAPITSEFGVSGASIQFLKTLQSIVLNAQGVEIVLSELPTRGYLAKPLPLWAQRAETSPAGVAYPVQQYLADCIDCLVATLSQKAAEELREPTKRGVFLLVNLSAVEHFITDSDTESLAQVQSKRGPPPPIMQALGEVGLQRFGKAVDAAFKLYLTEWNKLAPNLLDATMTNLAVNAKLSAKDREAVKEKFRVFNAEFEPLAERQKRFPISDGALKQRISQEVKKLIVPLYTRFYQKHRNGDFTKNIAKYVKYTPAEVESAVSF